MRHIFLTSSRAFSREQLCFSQAFSPAETGLGRPPPPPAGSPTEERHCTGSARSAGCFSRSRGSGRLGLRTQRSPPPSPRPEGRTPPLQPPPPGALGRARSLRERLDRETTGQVTAAVEEGARRSPLLHTATRRAHGSLQACLRTGDERKERSRKSRSVSPEAGTGTPETLLPPPAAAVLDQLMPAPARMRSCVHRKRPSAIRRPPRAGCGVR